MAATNTTVRHSVLYGMVAWVGAEWGQAIGDLMARATCISFERDKNKNMKEKP